MADAAPCGASWRRGFERGIMKISKQLQWLAIINGAALAVALSLSAYRLADLRHAFADYAEDQAVLYRLTEIKATTLAVSRADLLAADTEKQLTEADTLVRERWAALRAGLPQDQQETSEKQVIGNWSDFHKNFKSALTIFTTAPEDALSIPERIYSLYLVPLNQTLDRLIAARQVQATLHQVVIHHHIDNLLWGVLTPLSLAGVLVLVCQIRFGQGIRRRVVQMSQVSRLLAEGDLRTRLPAQGNDELGELAQRFNHFIAAFESILREVKLAASAVRQHAHQAAQRSVALGERSTVQATSLDETNQAIAEINAAIDLIASSAADASQSSAAVRNMGEVAQKIGVQTASELEGLGQTVALAAGQLSQLSHSITQIGNVSAMIKGIANQTNLLALNAAIEAARAGEHGRGFAVVADEVRALSERTAASTGQIETLLEQVWSASAEVVSSIRVAEANAGSGCEQGRRMQQNIIEMVPAIINVSSMLDGIASSTDEHSSATASIRELVDGATQVSRQVMEELAVARTEMQTLLAVADQIQQTTERFRVSGVEAGG
ncbi:MAG: methyl-accepting chemotaxis sensory transducer [Proteobacteria bacterium]|nr:methyl-accepting chemotaxis sensory transducer [Pseudomonadota bacterium]